MATEVIQFGKINKRKATLNSKRTDEEALVVINKHMQKHTDESNVCTDCEITQ